MKNLTSGAYLITCALIILVSKGNCQSRNQIFVGARPMGLGEAYTAIADDGNAVYWNPAGLPTLRRLEFNSMYANLYGIQGLRNLYLSFVLPLTPRYYIGASWFNFGFGDDELEYFTNKANLSFGARAYGNLYLGANLKYLDTDARLDGFSEGKGNGIGFDLSALYSHYFKKIGFMKQLSLGVTIHDAGGTRITYKETNKSETVLLQNIRWGFTLYPKDEISFKWFSLKDALMTFEFDDRFHMGIETWLRDILGVRAGFQKDFHGDEGITYSIGGSIKLPYVSMQLDYAYVMPPTLMPTHVFSLSFAPSLSPIKIIDINVNDLYASFYKSYATSKIGNVTVRNDYDKELKITVKVTIPGLTETPSQESFMLGPNEERTSLFSAIFSSDILNVKAPEFRQAKVRIEYKMKNEEKFTESTEKFRLYGRGAITWDDPRKAVAFVTKLDPNVEFLAMEATKDLPYRPELELGNLYTAAALFDAVGALGIKYHEDPENPFSVIPKSQHSVDYIKYPSQLLQDKQGDCDDLTALYASLLEFSGIKTALITTSNHITLMFDSGIHEQNWGVLPLGDSLIVVRDKTLWIPVEITEIGKPFQEAWEVGGRQYGEFKRDEEFNVFNVRDFEGVYLSALPEATQNRLPEMPPDTVLKRRTEKDFDFIEAVRSPLPVRAYLVKIQKEPANLRWANELGVVYAQQDSLTTSEKQFLHMLSFEPDNPSALNNLANVYCILGRFVDSETYYSKASTFLQNEPGIYLNLAILYQIWKVENPTDSLNLQNKSEQNLSKAFSLLKGDASKTFDLLGILEEDTDIEQKADFKSWVKSQSFAIKKFIRNNSKKYLFNRSVAGAQIERRGVKRGLDNARSYILWWSVDRSPK
jgi:hypothetical protein